MNATPRRPRIITLVVSAIIAFGLPISAVSSGSIAAGDGPDAQTAAVRWIR